MSYKFNCKKVISLLMAVLLLMGSTSYNVSCTDNDDGSHEIGGGGGDKSYAGSGIVYRVTFEGENIPVGDAQLQVEYEENGHVFNTSPAYPINGGNVYQPNSRTAYYKYFWYEPDFSDVNTEDKGMRLPVDGNYFLDKLLDDNVHDVNTYYIVDDLDGHVNKGVASRFINNSPDVYVGLNSGSFEKMHVKAIRLSELLKNSFWNCGSREEFFSIGDTDFTHGMNLFNNGETKWQAYQEFTGMFGDSTTFSQNDFMSNGLAICEKCVIVGDDGVTAVASYANFINWGVGVSEADIKSKGAAKINELLGSHKIKKKIGNTITDHCADTGRFYQISYKPLITEDLMGNGNFSRHAGNAIWGTIDEATPSKATNTLAVYNKEPVTGATVDGTDWEVYSTILDGKMPDSVDDDTTDLKYWDNSSSSWKQSSSFLEAIDGKSSTTLPNLEDGTYALIARDSYKTVNAPQYANVLLKDKVVGNNDAAQNVAMLLENPPEQTVWGSKTVQSLTGSSDSFGNVLTIETLNGLSFDQGTKGYAVGNGAFKGLQLATGVRSEGTLTNKPILEQVNNEIKIAMTKSSSGNVKGTGIATQFDTERKALGSAVEIVVRSKPVESDLHVVTVFDGVATLTPNVKNYKYTNVNYGIVDPQLDSGMSDPVQAVILVPKDGSPTGDSIVSSMTGTTPENAIPTFTSLSPDNREGAPIINVGNKEDKGYLIPSYNLTRLSSNDKYMVSVIDDADLF